MNIYILDTNILIDDPKSIDDLIDGGNNKVVIPYSVIIELDRLKQNPGKSHLVHETINHLNRSFQNDANSKNIIIVRRKNFNYNRENCRDETIIDDIQELIQSLGEDTSQFIFLSNDQILRLRVLIETDIQVQNYKRSQRFISDVERYTGFVGEEDHKIVNSFILKDNRVWSNKIEDFIPNCELYQLKPKNLFQNAAMFLLKDDDIKVVTIASPAGYGKSILSLAAALECIQSKKKEDEEVKEEPYKKRGRKKKNIEETNNEYKKIKSVYKKIFVVRPTIVIGNDLGFLPGDLDEKLDPFFRPMKDLLLKLHHQRQFNKMFIDGEQKKGLNKEVIEFLPINYIRGMNIENAIVVIDEAQNFSRMQMRYLLSRMGENTRIFIAGDTQQIDEPTLNASNNGINWILRKFIDLPAYGHITLQGHKSRGPITDLVLKTGL